METKHNTTKIHRWAMLFFPLSFWGPTNILQKCLNFPIWRTWKSVDFLWNCSCCSSAGCVICEPRVWESEFPSCLLGAKMSWSMCGTFHASWAALGKLCGPRRLPEEGSDQLLLSLYLEKPGRVVMHQNQHDSTNIIIVIAMNWSP